MRALVGSTLLGLARPYLINLDRRTDRYEATMTELAWVRGADLRPGVDIELIRPRRYTDAAGFINTSYRSCLEAHRAALRLASDQDVDIALVLEDDVVFTPRWHEVEAELVAALTDRHWDVVNIGVLGPQLDPSGDATPVLVPFRGEVIGSHAYLVRRRFLPRLLDHFGDVARGEPGDRLRGPMGPDGALNTIAWIEPSMTRLLAVPSLVDQRPSRSDVNTRAIDHVPLVRHGVSLGRAFRVRRHRRRRSTM